MSMIIAGKECENCCNCTFINEESKRDIKVFCRAKEKEYFYGQCIPCEFKKEKKENNEQSCEIL